MKIHIQGGTLIDPVAGTERQADVFVADGKIAALAEAGTAPAGFNAEKTAYLALPGPFERERLLAIELHHGALDGARGMIVATGAAAPEARSHRGRKPQRPMPRAA